MIHVALYLESNEEVDLPLFCVQAVPRVGEIITVLGGPSDRRQFFVLIVRHHVNAATASVMVASLVVKEIDSVPAAPE